MLHGLVEQLFHAKPKQKGCHVVVDGSSACSLCVQLAAWALHMLGAGSTSLDQVDRARSRCPLFVFVQNQKKKYGILGWWLGRLVFSDKCEHLEHPLIIPRS